MTGVSGVHSSETKRSNSVLFNIIRRKLCQREVKETGTKKQEDGMKAAKKDKECRKTTMRSQAPMIANKRRFGNKRRNDNDRVWSHTALRSMIPQEWWEWQ
jgi:hypothetical protein